MNIIYFLLPMALLLGGGFAFAFAYSSSRGQFDDLETPAHRMLIDSEPQIVNHATAVSTQDSLKGNAHE